MSYMLGKKKDKGERPVQIVPSLLKITSMWIRDHIHVDSVNHIISYIPNELLEIVLDGCPPEQLDKIEQFAQRDLSEVTEALWQKHCSTFLNVEMEMANKEDFDTWREYYQELMRQYEEKKLQCGKHLRTLYSEQAKEKASKKIKMLEATPVAKSRSGFFGSGSNVTYSSRAVSKPMAKCLKDMKKSQPLMTWKKPLQSSSSQLHKPGIANSLSQSKLLNIPAHKFTPPSAKQPQKALPAPSAPRAPSISKTTTPSPMHKPLSSTTHVLNKSPSLPSAKLAHPSSKPISSKPPSLPSTKSPLTPFKPSPLPSSKSSPSLSSSKPNTLPTKPQVTKSPQAPLPKSSSLSLPSKQSSLPPRTTTHSKLVQNTTHPIQKATRAGL